MGLDPVSMLAIGTVGSSLVGASSAKKAASAQADAAREANETQRYIFDQQTEMTAPWRETGENALAAMAYEVGIGERPTYGGTPSDLEIESYFTGGTTPGAPTDLFGGMSQVGSGDERFRVGDRDFGRRSGAQEYLDSLATDGFEYEGFKASPGYEFALEQGNLGLERQQAARGMRLGGPAMKEAMRYNSGIASQEYGNYYNRLAGLSGTGQTANTQQINVGTNYANAFGRNVRAAGDAQASGYMGVNNALQGGINNGFNIFGMQQAGMFGSSGGGGGGGYGGVL